MIDRELWEKRKILWCQALTDKLAETVYRKRNRPAPTKPPIDSDTVIPLDDRFKRKTSTEMTAISPLPVISEPVMPQSKAKERKEKERNPDGFLDTFILWNEQGIVKHDEPTYPMRKAFEKARKQYSLETIQGAIRRYGTVVRGNSTGEYWFSYRWRFDLFLSRKSAIPQFETDLCFSNFKEKNGKPGSKQIIVTNPDLKKCRDCTTEWKPRETGSYRCPKCYPVSTRVQ